MRRALWLAVVLLLGCETQEGASPGASGGAGRGGAAASQALESACRRFFLAQEALADRCDRQLAGSTHEEAFTRVCAALASLPGTSTSAERIRACADEIEQQAGCSWPACVTLAEVPMAAGTGTLAVGQGCESALQCASGLCSAGWGVGCGVCQESRKLGESCGAPTQRCETIHCIRGLCADGSSGLGGECSQHGAPSFCGSLYNCIPTQPGAGTGTCQPRPGLGEACDPGAELRCKTELRCEGGVCVERLADGTSCEPGDGCLHGCYEGVCQQRRLDAGPGEACDFHQCRPGLLCAGQQCVAPMPVGEGESCEIHFCEAGFFCSPARVCVAATPAGEGESCESRPCGPGLLCGLGFADEASRGFCVKLPGVGQPCVDLRCGPDAECREASFPENPGVCRALGREGEACPCIGELRCLGSTCQIPGEQACP